MKRLLGALAACGIWAAAVLGQSQPATTGPASQPTTDAALPQELPPEVRSKLATSEDFALDFGQPGFYAVLEYVKHSLTPPGHARPPIEVRDWRDFVERPKSFRGEPVTIEGIVGRSSSWHLRDRPALGDVWQLEISAPDQPIACTLIFPNNASDIPLGATVRVTGYFIMIRQYYDAKKQLRQAALLIAPGPTSIVQPGPSKTEPAAFEWKWLLAAAAGGLLVAWIVVRRAAAGGRRDVRGLRAQHTAPVNLADDLAAWAGEKPPVHEEDWKREFPADDEKPPPKTDSR